MVESREKYHFLGREFRALEALANNENGAEYGILELLSATLLSGEKVGADFQVVANAIVAKSVLCGRLPLKKRGRPKNPDGLNACDVAILYFALKDNGVSYENAVREVAASLCKDERHIMRLVREGTPQIGSTPAQRKEKREWWALCGEMRRSRIAAGEETYFDFATRIIKEADARNKHRDPIAELETLIDSEMEKINRPSRTTKLKNSFVSSQQIQAVFDGTDDSGLPPTSG